jgi:hypothetical protein
MNMIRLRYRRGKARGALLALVAALAFGLPETARAQGGPPLITDDPDTPGPGYWEVNLFGFLQRSRQQRLWEEPRVDLNYGVGRRIQLKLEAPWLRAHQVGGTTVSGAGDAQLGVKWRFLGEEGRKVAWSVYPQFAFNTSDASVRKGLVEDGHQLFLPTELTLEILHVELNLEVGRNLVEHGEDAWECGISTEAGVARGLELLGELHEEKTSSAPAEVLFNLGARYKVTRRFTLMLAAGHAFRGPGEERPRLLFLAGIQLNLPGTYRFGGRELPAEAHARPVRRGLT